MDAFNPGIIDFIPDDDKNVYIVGGTIRDLLIGHMPADIDLVVDGEIETTAEQIANNIKGKVIDLGKNNFPVFRVASPNLSVDICPLATSSIEADLRQRDFTINAMAYDVKRKKIIDCLDGQKDLKQKKIRMVSETAFRVDPARLVRAYRIAAVFRFSIDNGTKKAICKNKHFVTTVSGERIWAELVKLFSVPDAASVIKEMASSGLLTSIFPELQPAIGCRQNHYHQFDVFDHSLRVLEQIEFLLSGHDNPPTEITKLFKATNLFRELYLLKYSALLHDIGKPATRIVDADGSSRFPGHAAKGADMAAAINRRLKLSNRQHQISEAIIRHHIRPLFLFLANEKGTLGRRGTVRFYKHCGELTLPVVVHAMADIRAKKQTMDERDERFIAFCDGLVKTVAEILYNEQKMPPLINGHDLISVFGLSPSPRFKHLLDRVDEQRLAGVLSTRDQALKWVETYLNS